MGYLRQKTNTNYYNPTPLYGDIYVGQRWWSHGLLPEGTKPLFEPVLTQHETCSLAFIWEQEMRMKLTRNICSVIALLELSHLSGANEQKLAHST